MTAIRVEVSKSRFKSRKAPKRRTKRQKSAIAESLGIKRVLSLRQADKAFSAKIRARDGKCLFPGCNATDNIQCSHYVGRSNKSTRFDPDNCVTLCWAHHFKSKILGFEYQKQRKEKHGWDGQYTIFMKKWLGKERWNNLMEREKMHVKQQNAIIRCMVWLGLTDEL